MTLFTFSNTQRTIFLLASGMVLFANATFFFKLFHYALDENNYFIAFTSPFILWLMLVCVLNILLLLPHASWFKMMVVLLVLSSALGSYFIDTFGTIIDVAMFTNVMQTDSAEVLDLVSSTLLMHLLFALLFAYVILYKLPFTSTSYTKEFFNKASVALISFLMVAGLYMMLSKSYSAFFRNHSELKMYLNPVYPITSFSKYLVKKLKPKHAFQAIALDATKPVHEKKKLVVMVLGETARAHNFSLGGYDKPTNPLLAKRSDVLFLANTASCGTATAISVPCMFSKFGRSDWSDEKESYENVVDVLAKTGVRVMWRDNNSGADKGVAKRIKDSRFYGGQTFDDILLKEFQNDVDQAYEDTLIVLHQEGSHGPTYFKRYPDNFKQFSPTCDTQELDKCSQERIVNTYDNTILYTDYILNQTIELLKANENKYDTTLIYMSDHGESLGENGVYLHGLPYMIAPEVQKHVPAIIYVGESEAKKREALRQKTRERFSHDNLFHTLLGRFDVSTSEYKPHMDLLR